MRHLATAIGLILATPVLAEQAPITGDRPFAEKPFKAVEIATFEDPWALAFLPDGRMLVTEKKGRMLLVSADGRQRIAIEGVPAVGAAGQGALGEVVAHPDFADNRLVYFSYSTPGSPNGIVLARGRLAGGFDGARLEDVKTLYAAHPLKSGGHYAGRIAFSPDGFLFFSMGERQKFMPAQEREAVLGKIVRLTMDGNRRPAIRSPARVSMRRCGPMGTATRSALPLTDRVGSGMQRWDQKAATKLTSSCPVATMVGRWSPMETIMTASRYLTIRSAPISRRPR